MVVAQLGERFLPTPEFRSLNPDIGKILSTNHTIEKTKNIEKEAHLWKKNRLRDNESRGGNAKRVKVILAFKGYNLTNVTLNKYFE